MVELIVAGAILFTAYYLFGKMPSSGGRESFPDNSANVDRNGVKQNQKALTYTAKTREEFVRLNKASAARAYQA